MHYPTQPSHGELANTTTHRMTATPTHQTALLASFPHTRRHHPYAVTHQQVTLPLVPPERSDQSTLDALPGPLLLVLPRQRRGVHPPPHRQLGRRVCFFGGRGTSGCDPTLPCRTLIPGGSFLNRKRKRYRQREGDTSLYAQQGTGVRFTCHAVAQPMTSARPPRG